MPYDAIADKKKRTPPRSIIYSEDGHLTPSERRKLLATSHDQLRNFALAGWMVRKHTSYVSRFRFQAEADESRFPSRADALAWKTRLEAFIERRSHKSRFDVAGRYSRQAALTLTERMAVLDGDHYWLKLKPGAVQLIEADLVYDPENHTARQDAPGWIHGVQVDATGRPLRYSICNREGSRRVPGIRPRAENVLERAYRNRADQVRGVSPLSAALNTNQDLYEAFDLNLVKAKMHALFGVAIMKKSPQNASLLGGIPISSTVETEGAAEADDDDAATTNDIKANFVSPGSASVLELATDEDIKTIESSTPPQQFRDYSELMIHLALCALDLPYIFFDEKSGSFSIHRTARIEYDKSCAEKREANEELLDEWTAWQITLGVISGELELPTGWTVEDAAWDWVPESTPWFNEKDEVEAAVTGIRAGIISPVRHCKEHGGDVFQNIEDRAKVEEFARERGVALDWSAAPVTLQQVSTRRDDE